MITNSLSEEDDMIFGFSPPESPKLLMSSEHSAISEIPPMLLVMSSENSVIEDSEMPSKTFLKVEEPVKHLRTRETRNLEIENPQLNKDKSKQFLEERILTRIISDFQVFKTPSKKPVKSASQKTLRITLEIHNESSVNAFDGRAQIMNTAGWPYSVHGVVAFKFKNMTSWGTGTLIGPNVVLTAGHNLYSHKDKTYVDIKNLQYLPAMNGQILPFDLVEVGQYFVSPNYIKDETKEDYAILILKEPIGEITGYFGLACLEAEELAAKRVNVTGYPGDKVASKPNTFEMWGMEGVIARIDEARGYIHHLIDTGTGQSGSAIWYQEGEDYYICGVHISGGLTMNTATLLTKGMYQQIHNWLEQTNFSLFKLREKKKELYLGSHQINLEDIQLLTAENWEELIHLNLCDLNIGNKGAEALAQNISWINLSILDLSYNKIGREGAKGLAKNTSWINLSELYLFENDLGPEGVKELAQNTSWVSLSKLYLSYNNIGDEGAKALAQNISWIKLSTLYLSNNKIEVDGVRGLAQNTSWINLSELYLTNSGIQNEGADYLAQNISWVNLSKLHLAYNNIGAEGARALALNKSWIKLSILNLSHNKIGIDGAQGLAQNTSWINLLELYLMGNRIQNEGAGSLAKNISWIKLSTLDLSENKIGADGAKALAQNVSWIKLSKLDLQDNQVFSEGEMALKSNQYWSSPYIRVIPFRY